MTKEARGAWVGALVIDPEERMPLSRQVYLRIRELILEGTLPRGARLPSTRALAADLGLSRNTVIAAIEQLACEEYVSSRVGDGTYVAAAIPEDREALRRPERGATPAPSVAPARLSRRGELLKSTPIGRDSTDARAFAVGLPALDDFPWKTWHRLWMRRSRNLDRSFLCYGEPEGYWPLREEIAAYLTSGRGVRCTAGQVLVVSSSQQALDMASRVLLDPGDRAWLEDPGYLGARGALTAAGAEIVPVPVDDSGLRVDVGRQLAPDARLASVTPSHQYPLGVTMSLERRLELLAWAAESGSWIIEDDYDSEFRYVGSPLAALQGLDRAERVVYVGTFTKVIFPSLRLAYIVAPPHLIDALVAARSFTDRHSPTLPQVVLADFMAGGHFTAHIRRMRALYAERQECLVAALERRLGERCRPYPNPSGMHLVVDLPDSIDDVSVAGRLGEHGVAASPLSRYYLEAEPRNGLLLGYTVVPPGALEEGVEKLAAVLDATR